MEGGTWDWVFITVEGEAEGPTSDLLVLGQWD